MARPITRAEVGELLGEARAAYRLEQQPTYAADTETGAPGKWLAGDRSPVVATHPGVAGWFEHLDRLAAEDRTLERLRLVERPPTGYQRWAAWVARAMVERGEVIRYADRVAIEPLDNQDLWIFDRVTLVLIGYDNEGRAATYLRSSERGDVSRYLEWWDQATAEVEPMKGPEWTTPSSPTTSPNPADSLTG